MGDLRDEGPFEFAHGFDDPNPSQADEAVKPPWQKCESCGRRTILSRWCLKCRSEHYKASGK